MRKEFVLNKNYLSVTITKKCTIQCKEGRSLSLEEEGTYFLRKEDFLTSSNDTCLSLCHLVFVGDDLSGLVVKEIDFFSAPVSTSGGGGGGASITSITHSELLALLEGGSLKKGNWYRVTDYVCCVNPLITTIKSAGHQFDIILFATDNKTLSIDGLCAKHEGDAYFDNCDLSKWRVRYSVKNDQKLYPWCASDGKGVICYMKDEYNNECYYDFKNIMEARYEVTGVTDTELATLTFRQYTSMTSITGLTIDTANPVFFYTFSVNLKGDMNEILDLSVQDISSLTTSKGIVIGFGNNKLLDNHFIGGDASNFYINCFLLINGKYDLSEYTLEFIGFLAICDNTIGNFSCSNTFNCLCLLLKSDKKLNVSSQDAGNVLDINCYDNTFLEGYHSCNKLDANNYECFFGSITAENALGISSRSSFFGIQSFHNTVRASSYRTYFGKNCQYNIVGADSIDNTFNNGSSHNTLGAKSYDNRFSDDASWNSLGNGSYSNVLEGSSKYNSLGNGCYSNNLQKTTQNNSFGNYCHGNTLKKECYNNFLGNGCYSLYINEGSNGNTIGNSCSNLTLGANCMYNIFGNRCTEMNFGSGCFNNTVESYCSNVVFGQSFQNITLGSECSYIYLNGPVGSVKGYCRNVIVHNGVQGINVVANGTTSSSNYLQNIEIHSCDGGVSVSTFKTITIEGLNQNYKINVYLDNNGNLTQNHLGY